MFELGAPGAHVTLLQREHGNRVDDFGVVWIVLDQSVEMTAGIVVAFFADLQTGQCQTGVAGSRVGADEGGQAVDGGLD